MKFGLIVKRSSDLIFGKRLDFAKRLVNQYKNMSSEGGQGPSGHALNKLQFEKSPYLLQHQHNPVQWYPWGEEAFELASQQKKPIFLSVGYSTCHWCHVMERESFENADVAKVMNQYFINIKVDREERPDVDRVYMTFVQAVSGSGGWPMSVWMTPDLKPFYGGTYYPPDDRMFGRPGFKSLLLTIAEQWEEEKDRFVNSAEKILQVLKRTASLPVHDKPMVANEMSQKCLQQLSRSFEPAFGGFSDHPKFPQPVNLNFLIQYRKLNPEHGDSLKMIEKTLQGMAKGGIYDHIGKGFCRYSTDKKWHVPHFEKMLYDNAQLTVAYALAFQLTKNDEYARVAKEILEYIERDMSHDEGGFYSAEDADSYENFNSKTKAEGAFYVWTKEEIDETLKGKNVNDNVTLAELFNFRFGVRDGGNCDPHQDPHGELKNKNCLYIGHAADATAKKFNISVQEVQAAVAQAKLLLFEKRLQTKPRPGLDTKVIASWNGLMIGAFARAGVIFNIPHYIERAAKAMEFVNKYLLTSTGDLIRTCYREGETNSSPITNVENPILGCVDDFANLVAASLELFDATADLKYLQQALQLQQKQDQLFWDEEHGGYFNSRVNSECIVRIKDDDDGAEPSANSTSVLNMIRLHSITENNDMEKKIEKLFKQFGDRLVKIPMSLPLMTAAFQAHSNGTRFLLLLSNGADSETISQVRGRVLPFGSTVVFVDLSKPNLNLEEWKRLVPSFAEKLEEFQSGKASPVLFLKEGNKFTGTFDKSNLETLVNTL